MNMMLMPGWLMIKPLLPETKTKVGLELPADSIEQPPCGEVIEMGGPIYRKDESYEMPVIEKGDKVYFQKWGGLPMKIDGQFYMFVKYGDLVSVVKNEK